MPERPMYSVSPVPEAPVPPHTPPDVDGAVAAEAEALKQVKAYARAESWLPLLELLQRPNSMIGATSDGRLSELITKYYQAHYHLLSERQRQETFVDTSHLLPIRVVVALGEPKDRAIAEVRPWSRRDNTSPVIVVRPVATPEVLGAALEMLDELRARHTEADGFSGSLFDATSTKIDAAQRAQLVALLEQLQNAELRDIKGMGRIRAVDMWSPLGAR